LKLLVPPLLSFFFSVLAIYVISNRALERECASGRASALNNMDFPILFQSILGYPSFGPVSSLAKDPILPPTPDNGQFLQNAADAVATVDSQPPDRLPQSDPTSIRKRAAVSPTMTGRRRNLKARKGKLFVCPLYRFDPNRFGGPGGCADWCTPEIHRLFADHLKKHIHAGDITESLRLELKNAQFTGRGPEKAIRRWRGAYDVLCEELKLASKAQSEAIDPYYDPDTELVMGERDYSLITTNHVRFRCTMPVVRTPS
jgi:hypothetical protein